MDVVSTLLLLFIAFVSQTKGQNACSEYIVSVTLYDNFECNDVKFTCTYEGNPAYSSIEWDVRSNLADTPQPAYTYYPEFPDFTGPESGFEGRLLGSMENKTHTLTILKANSSDNLVYWRCLVKTVICSAGNPTLQTLNLTDPNFNNVTLLVDGIAKTSDVGDADDKSLRSRKGLKVTGCAISDLPSSVSLRGVDPDTQQQNCERVAGTLPQPWNCSVNGTISNPFLSIKESKYVYVVANMSSACSRQRGIDTQALNDGNHETPNDFQIIMQYSAGEIVVIIILIVVCVALTAVVVRFLILYCCLKWCRERDVCQPICVRVCCMPSNNKD